MALPTKRTALLCAMYAALSGLMCARLFVQPNGLGHYDWDVHLFYYAAVLKSVVEYAQWPFWNPWYCGGNVLWQNPQVALISPVYPLALVMPLALAMKVNIVIHYWIGFIGMHLLLRRIIGVRFLPLVVYLACVFVAGGALALHIAQGHSVFLPAFYLPLQLYWFARALSGGTMRDAGVAGALLALTVISGGVHVIPLAVVGIGTLALTAAVALRQWRPLLLAIMYGIAAVAFAAPKLVPMLSFLEGDRFVDQRQLQRPEPMTLAMVTHAYVDPSQTPILVLPGQLFGWHEYGNYIGLPALLLFAGSVAWVFVRRRSATHWLGVSLAVAALTLLALSFGDFSALAPATLARRVPLLSMFRIPSRYTIGFSLFATLTLGWALRDVSWDLMRTRRTQTVIGTLCLIASLDLIWRNGSHFNDVFSLRPLERGFSWLRRPGAPVTDTTINPYEGESPMLHALANDRSTFHCYEPLRLAAEVAEPAQPLVFGRGPLKVTSVLFTPNRIDVGVLGGPDASTLFVNQNYEPGWRSTLGDVTADPRYRNIAVSVPPWAAGRFAVAFVPRGLIAGFSIFGAAMLAAVGFWTRRR